MCRRDETAVNMLPSVMIHHDGWKHADLWSHIFAYFMEAYKSNRGVSVRNEEVPLKKICACETDMRKYLQRTVAC